MLGREARDNVSKALNLIQKAHSNGFEGMLLSIDTEKAFDRMSWDYLHATCNHIGSKPHMLSWISTIYHNPTARIKINGTLSDTVTISNRTRQGCPLSPLLFILTLELLIRMVNNSPSIQGFQVGTKTYKTVAYADKLLFFITQPHISLPNLCKIFTHYNYFSNLK